MLKIDYQPEQKILIVEPQGPLEESDFETLGKKIDGGNDVNGIVFRADAFPGWSSFDSFTAHMNFIKNHVNRLSKVKRGAFVTDNPMLRSAVSLGQQILKPELRAFDSTQLDAARSWVATGQG